MTGDQLALICSSPERLELFSFSFYLNIFYFQLDCRANMTPILRCHDESSAELASLQRQQVFTLNCGIQIVWALPLPSTCGVF